MLTVVLDALQAPCFVEIEWMVHFYLAPTWVTYSPDVNEIELQEVGEITTLNGQTNCGSIREKQEEVAREAS